MKKGQALVEFIIILPVFLILMLGIFDMGRILYTKISLEGKLTEAITLFDGGKTDTEISDKLELSKEKSKLEISEKESDVKFTLEKDIDIITPGLNLIFDNPYSVKVSRNIAHE